MRRRMLQIRKVQGEGKRKNCLITNMFLRAQAEREKEKRKQKNTNPAVRTERQGGILKRKIRTNITKVRPKKGLDPKARAKAKRCQKARRETLGTVNMKTRKRDQEAKRGITRKKRTKKNTTIFVGERGAEVRRRIKGQDLKAMVRTTLKVKMVINVQNLKVKNVSSLKANIAQIIRRENEAEVEIEASEPGPEVKNETAVEVKSTPDTRIRR